MTLTTPHIRSVAPRCTCIDGGDELTADGRCSRCYGRPQPAATSEDLQRRVTELQRVHDELWPDRLLIILDSEISEIYTALRAAERVLGQEFAHHA